MKIELNRPHIIRDDDDYVYSGIGDDQVLTCESFISDGDKLKACILRKVDQEGGALKIIKSYAADFKYPRTADSYGELLQ